MDFMEPPSSEPSPDVDKPADPQVLEPLMQEVEKQFSIMAVKARTAIRKRALDIHPELQPLGYRVLSILVRQQAQQQIVLALLGAARGQGHHEPDHQATAEPGPGDQGA